MEEEKEMEEEEKEKEKEKESGTITHFPFHSQTKWLHNISMLMLLFTMVMLV